MLEKWCSLSYQLARCTQLILKHERQKCPECVNLLNMFMNVFIAFVTESQCWWSGESAGLRPKFPGFRTRKTPVSTATSTILHKTWCRKIFQVTVEKWSPTLNRDLIEYDNSLGDVLICNGDHASPLTAVFGIFNQIFCLSFHMQLGPFKYFSLDLSFPRA